LVIPAEDEPKKQSATGVVAHTHHKQGEKKLHHNHAQDEMAEEDGIIPSYCESKIIT
jgi:hypothetical protein